METADFIDVVRRFEDENGLADVLYLEAIKKLRKVRENPQELNEKVARRIIRPFLACWGRMGRNVERDDFDWSKLAGAIKNQKDNLDRLSDEALLDAKFEKIADNVKKIYNGIKVRHLGPTGISKTLHLVNPELFVMWDDDIRKKISNKPFSRSSKGYLEFLKWIQNEIIEATKGITIEEIRNRVDGEYIDRKTMAKLADEYCWQLVHKK